MAIADAMKTEYRMIVDAGFILQIDDPRMVTEWDSMDPAPSPRSTAEFADLRIEALNHALAGLPEDRVRYHMCWGSWHGPAHDGRAAGGDRARHPQGQRRRLFARGGEPAPRARVPRLGAHQAPGRQDPHPGRHRAHDELRRASGAGRGTDPALRQARRARERHRRRGLRLRAGPRDRARAPEHHVGEVPHARGGSPAGESAPLGDPPAQWAARDPSDRTISSEEHTIWMS